jgi:hypothetical protein
VLQELSQSDPPCGFPYGCPFVKDLRLTDSQYMQRSVCLRFGVISAINLGTPRRMLLTAAAGSILVQFPSFRDSMWQDTLE